MRKVVGFVLLAPVVLVFAAWAALALHYCLSPYAAGAFLMLAAGGFIRFRWRAVPWFFVAFLGVFLWWWQIEPRNDRDWRVELAVLPRAVFDGDKVTIRNIRNFDYRSENDFDVRYYDKTFDLGQLKTMDLVISYWGVEEAAHTMLSFGFADKDYVTLSVEIRREKGEDWGGLPGLFKQFEIIYVLADERDVIRLRTNYRGEEVYVYPSTATAEDVRRLFVHILGKVNDLNENPMYYRTIGNNCTTSIVGHINTIWPGRVPWTRAIIMNGYLAEQAYQRGTIPHDVPFEELKRRQNVTEVAKKNDQAADFSRRIRAAFR